MVVAAIESREGSEFNDVAPLVSGQRGGELLESGDMEHGIWWAGMSSGLVYDVPTIDELVTRIVSDAESIIKNRLMSIVG